MRLSPHLLLRHPRLLAACVLLAAAASLRADPVRLTDDAGIFTNKANKNTGLSPSFQVKGAAGVLKEAVGYLKFDLSSLPAGTTADQVNKATLRVFVDSSTKAGGTFDVRAITSAWAEDTLTASNAPTLGDTVATAVPAGPEANLNYIDIDITSLAKQWLAGSLANNGVALMPNANIAATFDTKESLTTSHPATLDVSLASDGPQGPVGPQGPAGATGATGAQGPAGETGATGAVGATGPQGLTGAPGAPGTTGPQGVPGTPGTNGADGAAATVTIGTTTNGAEGSAATVTNSGTTSAAILNFTIPTGAPGSLRVYGDGEAGVRNITTTPTATFAEDNTQYTNFTVGTGVTLTVSSGTIIH